MTRVIFLWSCCAISR